MDIATRRIKFGRIEKDGKRYTKDGYFYSERTSDESGWTDIEYCIHKDGTCLYRYEDGEYLFYTEGHFDPSKFNEYVKKMEEFDKSWVEELQI